MRLGHPVAPIVLTTEEREKSRAQGAPPDNGPSAGPAGASGTAMRRRGNRDRDCAGRACELRLVIDGGELTRSQVCRSNDEILDTQEQWKSAMVGKGWSVPLVCPLNRRLVTLVGVQLLAQNPQSVR
jgi:hypothetical protein